MNPNARLFNVSRKEIRKKNLRKRREDFFSITSLLTQCRILSLTHTIIMFLNKYDQTFFDISRPIQSSFIAHHYSKNYGAMRLKLTYYTTTIQYTTEMLNYFKKCHKVSQLKWLNLEVMMLLLHDFFLYFQSLLVFLSSFKDETIWRFLVRWPGNLKQR